MTLYQWIKSWGYGIHGYNGPDPYSKTGIRYYIFTIYSLDTIFIMDPKNTSKSKVLRVIESVKALGSVKYPGCLPES